MKIRTKSPQANWSDDIEQTVRARVREVHERLQKAGLNDVHIAWADMSGGQCELDLTGPQDQMQRAIEALADVGEPSEL